MCLGQTWYLSCEMWLFITSPLIVYPLWRSKFGKSHKILGIIWWLFILCSSITATFLNYYIFGNDYESERREYYMPPWHFAPWGERNQCYFLGLFVGYILHSTKNKPIQISPLLNIVIWQMVSLIGITMVYGYYYVDTLEEYNLFNSLTRKERVRFYY